MRIWQPEPGAGRRRHDCGAPAARTRKNRNGKSETALKMDLPPARDSGQDSRRDSPRASTPAIPLATVTDGWLATKFFPPVSIGQLVERSRLIARLTAPQTPRMMIVTAPAGYGKTTVLAQAEAILRGSGQATAWLSLDERDREPRNLLRALCESLRSRGVFVSEKVDNLLTTVTDIRLIEVMQQLCLDLAATSPSLVCFFDDYHLADSTAARDLLQALMVLAPPTLRLVVAGRTLPELPLPRLKLRGEMAHIGIDDLQFDQQEASSFLTQLRGVQLDDAQMELLFNQTEGWIAGLQLAALALEGSDDHSRVLASFKGDMRDVADYLASDVLARQNDELQIFLLKTAVLERLCAGACEHITGMTDAQAMLRHVESLNLFLVSLDLNGQWYRYHHMFRDFLLAQLDRRWPDARRELYRRASDWFAASDRAEEALHYALLGEDFDAAAAIIERHATQLMFAGRMPELAQWTQRIPSSVAVRRPRLPIYQGWALFHMRQPREATAALERAETILETHVATGFLSDPAEVGELTEALDILRAGVALICDQQQRAYDITHRLLSTARHLREFNLGTVANIHGYAAHMLGRNEEAKAALRRARAHHEACSSYFGAVYATAFMALIEIAAGNSRRAYDLLERIERDTLAREQRRTTSSAAPAALRASILYRWNRIDEADALLEAYLPLLTDCGHPDCAAIGFETAAWIAFHRGDDARVESRLVEAASDSDNDVSDRLSLRLEYHRIRFALLRDRLDIAERRAEWLGITAGDEMDSRDRAFDRIAFRRDLIRLRLAAFRRDSDRARLIGDRLGDIAAKAGHLQRQMEVAAIMAGVEWLTGAADRAMVHMAEAVRLASRDGAIRSLLNEPGLPPILQHLQRDPLHGGGLTAEAQVHLRHILSAAAETCERAPRPYPSPATPAQPVSDIHHDLSPREVDVLRLLAIGRSNRAIGHELNVAENTIKWHIKNIFDKLGVKNRTEAVILVKDRGLI